MPSSVEQDNEFTGGGTQDLDDAHNATTTSAPSAMASREFVGCGGHGVFDAI